MKVKIKNGDDYVEVDSVFPDDMIDYNDMDGNLEDTLELDVDEIAGEIDE